MSYGLYAAATSTVVLVGGITESGLTALGLRELSTLRGDARERLLSNLVGLRIALTVIGVAAAVAITWSTGAEPEIVEGIWIAGIGALLIVVQQTYMIPLSAQLQLGWVSSMELLRQVALNGLFLAFVIVSAGLTAFYWAHVLAGAIVLIATLLWSAATPRCGPRSTSRSGAGYWWRPCRTQSRRPSESSTSGSPCC